MRKLISILFIIILNCLNIYGQIQTDDSKNINNLIENLYSKNDEIALNAFIELSECNPEILTKKLDTIQRYYKDGRHINYSLPTFTVKFLRQLVLYTEYCRNSNILYKTDKKLQLLLLELRNYRRNYDFPKKYQLENKILSYITLENISELEYWGMIYENYYPIQFSIGRIIDIFYSQYFDEILSNEKYLKLYLKKSFLFDKLGIVGICNNYLYKFIGIDKQKMSYLFNINTTDKDILTQLEKAKSISISNIKSYTVKYENFDTTNYSIPNIETTFNYFKQNKNKITENLTDSLFEVISWTSYDQIPLVLNFLDNTKFGKNKQFYNFLEKDFGFFLIDDVEKRKTRKLFMRLYRSKTEQELYSYLLDASKVDYKDDNGNLNFQKIHTILKYDVVEAFVGGGCYVRDFNTYALIKLLQIHFKTRLGFSNKQCRSKESYACDNIDNCIRWTEFLEENNYVDKKMRYPLSFHHLIYKYE